MTLRPKLGACVPSGCNYKDITNNFNEVYSESHLTVTILPCSTKASKEAKQGLKTNPQYGYV